MGKKSINQIQKKVLSPDKRSVDMEEADGEQRFANERLAVIVGSNLFEKPEEVDLAGDCAEEDLGKYDVPKDFDDRSDEDWYNLTISKGWQNV